MKTKSLFFFLLCCSFFFSGFTLNAREKAVVPLQRAEREAAPENTSKGTILITATTDYDYVLRFSIALSGPASYTQLVEGGEILLEVEPGTYRVGYTSGDVMANGKRLHLPCSFSPKEVTIKAGEYVVIVATL